MITLNLQNLVLFGDVEQQILMTSVTNMLHDVQQSLEDSVASHRVGMPHPVTEMLPPHGCPGAPRKIIDRAWLEWAISRRNTSDIARFLGVSRDLVRRQIIGYGWRDPQDNPLLRFRDPDDPTVVRYQQIYSVSGPVSTWSDEELDAAIVQLRVLFPKSGVAMLHGSLRGMGHNVPRERIRLSLLRIDPENRLFERPLIQRREYWVPGPNYLWHHDGQHSEHAYDVLATPFLTQFLLF
jgi:hypothetical protein